MFEFKPGWRGFAVAVVALIVLASTTVVLGACGDEAPGEDAAAVVGDLTVIEPWIRAGMAGRPTAGYMLIHNAGETPDRLVGAFADVAEETQIHESRMGDAGEMMMVHMEDSIEVPANGDLVLKPESYHVMLLGLARDLAEGETIPLTLSFENAGDVTLEAEVRPMAEMGGTDHE